MKHEQIVSLVEYLDGLSENDILFTDIDETVMVSSRQNGDQVQRALGSSAWFHFFSAFLKYVFIMFSLFLGFFVQKCSSLARKNHLLFRENNIF